MSEGTQINYFTKELIQEMLLGSAKEMIRGKLESKNSSSPRFL